MLGRRRGDAGQHSREVAAGRTDARLPQLPEQLLLGAAYGSQCPVRRVGDTGGGGVGQLGVGDRAHEHLAVGGVGGGQGREPGGEPRGCGGCQHALGAHQLDDDGGHQLGVLRRLR